TTLVIGAGQSGLAMSRYLTEASVDHVLLERGEVAQSWRTGRWDSLRLLTPNWLNRLPGYRYRGDDPDGFMSMPEVVEYLSGFAGAISAPVEPQTEVTSLRAVDGGFHVVTSGGAWRARTVVLASGPYNVADVPAVAAAIPPGVACVTPDEYRNPEQLEEGGVLVVGAAATGIQLADEIHRSGRQVTLAVGSHVRLPRLYRGMDIMWWLDGAGILDERYDEVDDVVRARNVASFQLVGSPERATMDLNALQSIGVRLVGRLAGVTAEGTAQFSGSLPNQCTLADLKLGRLLDTVDAWASEHGLDSETEPPERFEPTRLPADSPLMLSFRSAGIRTVVWATGFRAEYPYLEVPVLDAKGRVRHDGGVTPQPGLYVIGAPVLRRRKSTLIDGAGDDARDLSAHLVAHLDELAHAR
ncbi:MAG TPA: NAD(P)-binding domain-containing protein, partial [Acidimicrobiales bacterium]|nr:NAD(P)-binding domain-containing protein [Acidimicrobiales bacterium]